MLKIRQTGLWYGGKNKKQTFSDFKRLNQG